MEVVLLAHLNLNRIGSAGGNGWYAKQRTQVFCTEVANADRSTLRSLVIEIAEANGETVGALESMKFEQGYSGSVFSTSKGPTFHTAPPTPSAKSSTP